MRRSGLRGLRLLAAAVVVLLASCASGPSGVQPGHVFIDTSRAQEGIPASPPGSEWGYQVAWLQNKTSTPVELRSVSLVGKGLGTVVQPVSIRVNTKYPTTRISHYVTDPPVLEDGPLCITSSLAPVAGYVLPPGGPPVTLYVVMRSLRPGHFTIEGHSIVYQQGRWTYRQLQPLGVYGSVSAAASPLRPTPEEQACVNGNVRIFPQPTAAATT